MAKPRSVYRCTECGHDHPKWVGKCEACAAWNTVAEEPIAVARKTAEPAGRRAMGECGPGRLRDIEESRLVRWSTGMPELDFVLGCGIVPGSMILVGGEPGIGKSTLLLQAAARLEASGRKVLYASGEESPEQIRLRASRLVEDAGPVHVVGETRLEAILDAAQDAGRGPADPRLHPDGVHRPAGRSARATSGRCGSAPPGSCGSPRKPARR